MSQTFAKCKQAKLALYDFFPWEIHFLHERHFPASSDPRNPSCTGTAAESESLPEHVLLVGCEAPGL